MERSELKAMKKESLLRRVKELENQIETLNNTKRNTMTSSTTVAPSQGGYNAEASLIEMWNKVDDVGARLTNVYSENKSLKERIKELEGDQNEMEDRIYYLERKLYSLDAYTTNKAISPEAKTPPELNMRDERRGRDFFRPNGTDRQCKNQHGEDQDNVIRDSNHGSGRRSTHRRSSEPPNSSFSAPPLHPKFSSYDSSPMKRNVVEKQSEIEMVRIAGKKLVGKLKQFSIRRNIEVRCSSLDVSLEEVTSHNDTTSQEQQQQQHSATTDTTTAGAADVSKDDPKGRNTTKTKEEARMTSDTSDSDDIRSSSEDVSAHENDDEEEAHTPVINKVIISSRWNNIEITRSSNDGAAE